MQLCKILSILSLANGVASQTTTCYWPDGRPNTVLKPCPTPQGKAAAACCYDDHYCLTNGLCVDSEDDTLYRGACTDPNFGAEGCPKYCDRFEIPSAAPGGHSGLWGCGEAATYACYNPDNCPRANFTIELPGKITLNTAVESDLGITATATSSSKTDGNTGISAGAAAGIGVGVGVPLAIAVVVLSFLLVRERKKVKAAEAATPMGAFSSPDPKYGPPPPWAPGQHGNAVSPEMPTATLQARHELPQ